MVRRFILLAMLLAMFQGGEPTSGADDHHSFMPIGKSNLNDPNVLEELCRGA